MSINTGNTRLSYTPTDFPSGTPAKQSPLDEDVDHSPLMSALVDRSQEHGGESSISARSMLEGTPSSASRLKESSSQEKSQEKSIGPRVTTSSPKPVNSGDVDPLHFSPQAQAISPKPIASKGDVVQFDEAPESN
ncbi:hypothetical protein [Variovorax saccharolyticus]|uniref:hypothetical protein n=1 Tax=Variovorax saccharolyticus TaxID=3053516 RepID=UPI002575D6A4|nr:hypothetical protein [Variovorax sp. J31P216]MDM0030478.1 hypothetical protein [Variovorax sp. J31P216]